MKLDLFSSSPGPAHEPEDRARGTSLDASLLATLQAGGARAGEEWSVARVNAAAKELLEGIFPPLWVTGEISNFVRARSGHCYFTLRDADAQLRCVMWRDDARRLPTAPEEGMAIRALGRLTLYPARGDLQLSVARLEARGEGLWKLALERLRRKLESEGLTAPARKRPLPRHPQVLGVVTSPSGAVFHDIVNVVRRRAPWTRIVLAGCRVQGEGAAEEIAGAIERLAAEGSAELLIVGRGGGSIEDLWAFNEEVVARAIAASPIPVISAVGHETDITIADLVADLRAPTPSAAAEAAVPDGAELLRALDRDGWRLSRALASGLGRAQERVNLAGAGLRSAADSFTRERRERLRLAARQLEALSPVAAFARGYAAPLSPEGRLLRTVEELHAAGDFELRVSDGAVRCRTLEEGDHDPER